MAKGEIVVGLDIGTTKVCAVIAQVGTDGPDGAAAAVEALGVGIAPSLGIRRGVVVDIEQTTRAIRDAVDAAQRMAGADVHSVIVGVTGEHISSLNSRGVIAITHADREVTQEDVDRVLESARVIVLPPDREIIHAIPRGYGLDGQGGIRNPVGMSGTRLEVETHIVTGATTFLHNVAKCIERADLAVEDTVLEPIATAEACLMDAEKDLGVVLVDIGGGTADVAIFRAGEICYSAVVPVGGNYVSRDIQAGLRTTLEEAERIKREYGTTLLKGVPDEGTFTFTRMGIDEETTLPRKVLAEIIEPRMAELFQMVRHEITRSGFSAILPAGLVLSGGGSQLHGTQEIAAEITGLPTRLAAPTGIVGLPDELGGPSFSTVTGLVLWGARAHLGLPRRGSGNGMMAAILGWMRRILRFGG